MNNKNLYLYAAILLGNSQKVPRWVFERYLGYLLNDEVKARNEIESAIEDSLLECEKNYYKLTDKGREVIMSKKEDLFELYEDLNQNLRKTNRISFNELNLLLLSNLYKE